MPGGWRGGPTALSVRKGNRANPHTATCPNAAGMLTNTSSIRARQQLGPRGSNPLPAGGGAAPWDRPSPGRRMRLLITWSQERRRPSAPAPTPGHPKPRRPRPQERNRGHPSVYTGRGHRSDCPDAWGATLRSGAQTGLQQCPKALGPYSASRETAATATRPPCQWPRPHSLIPATEMC